MTATIISFIDLLLVALLVGTMFGIWIGFDPAGLSAITYVEQQQRCIRALNTPMPILGAACIVLTIVLAVLTKDNPSARAILVAAVACMILAGVVTRFANQPINSQVMTWIIQSPPGNWMELRDRWWHWHIVRTLAGLVSLCLLISAVLISRNPPN